MNMGLKTIGNKNGKFVALDASLWDSSECLEMQSLVNLEIHQGLYKSMELVDGEKSYT